MNTIDNFAIDTFRNCPRSHYWRIQRNLIKVTDTKLAAEFGSAAHIVLEKYYGNGMSQQGIDEGLVEGVKYFLPFQVEGDTKRTTDRLSTIMDKYFKRYHEKEPFLPIAVEVGGAFELSPNWIYTSRLDLLAQWNSPNGVYIIDHKTTYDINSLIAKPHNQVTGYIKTAVEMYENVLGAIINGIGTYESDTITDKNAPKVPSEKTGKLIYATKEREFFIRIPTQRTKWELDEWTKEVLWVLHQIEDCVEHNMWPKHAPDHCVKYRGRCAYLDLCNASPDTAERLIESGAYVESEWNAYKEEGSEVNGNGN